MAPWSSGAIKAGKSLWVCHETAVSSVLPALTVVSCITSPGPVYTYLVPAFSVVLCYSVVLTLLVIAPLLCVFCFPFCSVFSFVYTWYVYIYVSRLLAWVCCAWRTRYDGMALHCLTSLPVLLYDVLRRMISLCRRLWPQTWNLSRTKNQHGHCVCWMPTGRNNGFMFNVKNTLYSTIFVL